ncbi:PLC-like phosphodiesterase [Mycena venus]|uniref:PLC-like phosphodiesterase n=1 Tax=Mycena venus TaxID=2733690 RepID=A0A8H6XVA1_9AGAR|nr:PLC-like phosphodiesterase [Mycena venus]
MSFDPGRVYDEGSCDKAIRKARAHLENDYPGCFVLIHSRKSGKVRVIRKDPPFGQTNIVAGRLEIKAHTLFGRTFGYDYYVLAEGFLSYEGNTGPAYLAVSEGTMADVQVQTAYLTMARRDGHPNRFRRTLFVDPANWMGDSRIDGTRFLSEFTLPGTHDSHATGGNVPILMASIPRMKGWVTCQSWGVRKQLELGVRFVDLRVGTGMKMVHGRSDLTRDLWGVMDELTGFLRDHPSETVIVSVKWSERRLWGNSTAVGTLVHTTIPTLDEVRGKMILLRRFANSNLGLELGNQVQDGGAPSPSLPPGLNDKEQHWFMNRNRLSSYDWGKGLNPWDFASYENPMLQQYLEEINVPRAEKLGLVIFDFLDGLYTPFGWGKDSACFLSEKLILTNFD